MTNAFNNDSTNGTTNGNAQQGVLNGPHFDAANSTLSFPADYNSGVQLDMLMHALAFAPSVEGWTDLKQLQIAYALYERYLQEGGESVLGGFDKYVESHQ